MVTEIELFEWLQREGELFELLQREGRLNGYRDRAV